MVSLGKWQQHRFFDCNFTNGGMNGHEWHTYCVVMANTGTYCCSIFYACGETTSINLPPATVLLAASPAPASPASSSR